MGFLKRIFGSADRAANTTATAWMMKPRRPDAVVEVVGEASYQPAILKVAGGRTSEGLAKAFHVAVLVREPNNQYDANAISVRIDGRVVGYLDRATAVQYGTVAAFASAQDRLIACDAALTGGFELVNGEAATIGVALHLGSPGECYLQMLEMLGGNIAVREDHPWPGYLVAFTGDSLCSIQGVTLDRALSEALAAKADLTVHPRVTKKVQLLVDCDPTSASGNEKKATEYDIPVIPESEFWHALGLEVQQVDWRQRAARPRRF